MRTVSRFLFYSAHNHFHNLDHHVLNDINTVKVEDALSPIKRISIPKTLLLRRPPGVPYSYYTINLANNLISRIIAIF